MSPNGVRLPAAATLPTPLVDVTFLSRLVMSTSLALRCWFGVADASICMARKDTASLVNILSMTLHYKVLAKKESRCMFIERTAARQGCGR